MWPRGCRSMWPWGCRSMWPWHLALACGPGGLSLLSLLRYNHACAIVQCPQLHVIHASACLHWPILGERVYRGRGWPCPPSPQPKASPDPDFTAHSPWHQQSAMPQPCPISVLCSVYDALGLHQSCAFHPHDASGQHHTERHRKPIIKLNPAVPYPN